jgi:ADP-heptose:LPS heptosyltransferase
MAQRALLIQLARLGDLVQTIPAITALKECHAGLTLDLLCPTSLEAIGRMFPGISRVVKWDGAAWNRQAMSARAEVRSEHVAEAEAELRAIAEELYDHAFVLNQHARSILAGALLAKKIVGTITGDPLEQKLSPWATYVRSVAAEKGNNRIHLADAFCGMCGVPPPKRAMSIAVPAAPLPVDLDPIGQSEGPWIGLLIGAGDRERLVPVTAWARVMTDCLEVLPCSRIVLMGHEQEQERAQWIQTALPASHLGRVWDTTGRLTLLQLANVLTRCQVIIGADTGPLHLAAAVGTPVIGWYFARARVHETGPYGPNHWVWQAEGAEREERKLITPCRWPIDGTIALLSHQSTASAEDWSLWTSHRDQWGAYYIQAGHETIAPPQRERIWRELQPTPV